ncbi:MAG: MOSC N-terminal beta barrel domain-containing protein [Planctomycetia bacterium]|nr:MOSC N-terminal beta barrel domain-containing protein [Planctomycetia bacterium]
MTLARVLIYPVKSLDAVEVSSARVLPSGGLELDRRWAICDESGQFVNGKRTPAVHGIRAAFDLARRSVKLSAGGLTLPDRQVADAELSLDDVAGLERWFSDTFGFNVRVLENPITGMPDDLDAPGPTIISAATLREVAGWFGLDAEETCRRFRPNLVVGGVEPFFEDRLYGPPGVGVEFRIGEVVFEGSNPCARCIVPTRHPETGQVQHEFSKTFRRRREETLPAWADRRRFDHFYRLAVNTRLSPRNRGTMIRVDDEVQLCK